jgi:hypothetical protein
MSLEADMARYWNPTPQQVAWFTAVGELADVSMSLDYDALTDDERAQLVTKKRELLAECDRLQALVVNHE